MPNTPHSAPNVVTSTTDGKRYRPGRDLYLAARGGLIAKGTYIVRWAEEQGHTRQAVEMALHGVSNSDLAKTIRGQIAAELGLLIEEES
jgi:hypothetical protein